MEAVVLAADGFSVAGGTGSRTHDGNGSAGKTNERVHILDGDAEKAELLSNGSVGSGSGGITALNGSRVALGSWDGVCGAIFKEESMVNKQTIVDDGTRSLTPQG